MRIAGAFVFAIACSRTELEAPLASDASSTGTPQICAPGDAPVVLATFPSMVDFPWSLSTDGVWLYGGTDNGTWVMPTGGGERHYALTHPPYIFNELDLYNDGMFLLSNGDDTTILSWMRHDGSDLHEVVSTVNDGRVFAFVVPPIVYTMQVGPSEELHALALDGSSNALLASFGHDLQGIALALSDKYVHVMDSGASAEAVDHRVDRGDRSIHEVHLGAPALFGEYPFVPPIAPNAACWGVWCALDETDTAVTFALDDASVALVDADWAYFNSPSRGFLRANLRHPSHMQSLWADTVPAVTAANGCVYVAVAMESTRQLLRLSP